MDTSTRAPARGVDADLRRELIRSLALPVGGAAALALPIAMIPVRSHLSRPLSMLPAAVLVLVVALIGGRAAGIVAALVAGLSVDSFLHEPYGVLSLYQWAFWSSTAALVVVAVVVGVRSPRGRTG